MPSVPATGHRQFLHNVPVEAMENCGELFCNKSLHRLAGRHFDLFDDVSFHFHNVRRCNVVFSRQKTHEIYVKASVTVQVLGEISFHVMTEKWKHQLRIHLPFRRSLSVRIEIESR